MAHPEPSLIGESPVWSVAEQALYWIDNWGEKIHRRGLDGSHREWRLNGRIGAVGLRADGGLIATKNDGIYNVDIVGDQVEEQLLVCPDLPPGGRLREGKVDSSGRFWFGSMGATRDAANGGLFNLFADGRLTQQDSGLMVANGIAFGRDTTTMLMADTHADRLYSYSVDSQSGAVTHRRDFFSTYDFHGLMDGATMDTDGGYWCAFFDDWSIVRIAPDGHIDRMVRMPVRYPTMCAFGGPNLDIMYVTSASAFVSEDERPCQPQAGMLFEVHGLGVKGIPEPVFGMSV
ncbi:6-deoxy-6-sulfogluconolactonase [Paraburkholderia fynbosensis]|uniref:Regucalcin n=1 Tax=Paraburkholderia fynbosensis TaxID=1200993 RepID=A0A6J5H0Y5_9BURK|nr:6-deoxy-6-sulfogluconolactonase [Paraburkholderia fynbosensis]